MKQFSIVSMVLLAIIFAVFVVMVPKYPDLKSIDLRSSQISELLNSQVPEK